MAEAEYRPFHETIIAEIKRAGNCEIVVLARLIQVTKIPAGHDAIQQVLLARVHELGGVNCAEVPRAVASLQEQKAITEAEAADSGKVEKEMLERALKKTDGNKTRAAAILGITRRAIYSRMQKHGLA